MGWLIIANIFFEKFSRYFITYKIYGPLIIFYPPLLATTMAHHDDSKWANTKQ
jgi:hypothetical protein